MTPSDRRAVFLINLVQDVNILRPLVFMARDFGLKSQLLVSAKFTGRDLFGIWRRELDQLCAETGAELRFFGSDWEAWGSLEGQGLIFAASESHLPNHVTTHAVFRYAPPTFLRVTLQHGFECVGFRHSADHVRAHGESASFGADIVCAWQEPEYLRSMALSQRSKLLVTGPTAVLQMPVGEAEPDQRGVVCENLHSVRLNGAGDFKIEFVEAFDEFCALLAKDKGEVVLRPHPGGQYVLKNKVPLPANASINNAPMYRVDLRRFAYGISAPSSVLIDMLLAGIPTAVWRDAAGGMDAGNYTGLTTVSSPREWIEFSQAAIADPQPFRDLQQRFLDAENMPLAPRDVFSRYAELFQAARRMDVRPPAFAPERDRILVFANSNVPTVQLSFEKPLAPLVGRGEIATELVTEQELREQLGGSGDSQSIATWMQRRLDGFDPAVIVFSRYSGPGGEAVVEWARRNDVPVIYHLDDDLLAIPPDIGVRKFEHHNSPQRLAAVRFLLTHADLVYTSTQNLRERMLGYYPDARVVAGKIYCSGEVLQRPKPGPSVTVGYMASADHAHNLDMVLPAVERLLDRNPHVQFELFGSIPVPPSLARFGERVTTAPPVTNYQEFLKEFAAREWDVGICPLVGIEFNMMKSDTKWVEYTSCGAAVVASKDTVYERCCADGCGILAADENEWFEALHLLVNDREARLAMIQRAQDKLEQEYSVARLRDQLFDVISMSRANKAQTQEIHEEKPVCQTA